ncbi:hypothetical protein ACHAQJ_005955 [Trichoderma viride]
MSDHQGVEPSSIVSNAFSHDSLALNDDSNTESQLNSQSEDQNSSALCVFSDDQDNIEREDSNQGIRTVQEKYQGQDSLQNKKVLREELVNSDEATMRIPQLEFPLTSNTTVVQALLLSKLKLAASDALIAFERINAVMDSVQSNQSPPLLKVTIHNVDAKAFNKIMKGKKVSNSASGDDSPKQIAPHSACAGCRHDPATNKPALTLLSCDNCKSIEYCSIQCQLADWTAHKNIYCVEPAIIPLDTLVKPHLTSFLKTSLANPFARLSKGIWLHDRHKQDVYALVIDSFRLREADDFWYAGQKNNESIFNGRMSSCPPFRRFLDQAEAKGLMPPWWSDKKRVECLTLGLDQRSDNYHDLYATTRDVEILVKYEDAIMTMQLRMFAESILGRGPAGTDGRLMLQKMVVAEEAARASVGK